MALKFFKHQPSGPFPVGASDLTYLNGKELNPEHHLVGRLFYPTATSKTLPLSFWIPHRNYAYGTS